MIINEATEFRDYTMRGLKIKLHNGTIVWISKYSLYKPNEISYVLNKEDINDPLKYIKYDIDHKSLLQCEVYIEDSFLVKPGEQIKINT